MNNKSHYLFYTLAGFILSIPFFIYPIVNCDIGWHLSNGRYIIENLKIPDNDFISWMGDGRMWINSEWLVHVIYYLVYRIDGYFSLYLFKFFNMILLCCGFYLLYAVRLKIAPFMMLWFIPSIFLSFALSLDLRPDNYTFFFFTLLIFMLEGLKDQEFSFKKALSLFFLFALWVNVHSGYIFGFVAVAVYFAAALVEEIIIYFKDKRNTDFKKTGVFLKYLLFSVSAIVVNPYGYKIIIVFFQHYRDMGKIADYISEWQYPDIFINISSLYYFVLCFLTLFYYLVDFIKKRKFELSDIFLTTAFVMSSLMHLRLAGFGNIIIHMIVTKYIIKDFEEKKYLRYIFHLLFCMFYFGFEVYYNMISSYPFFSNGIFYKNIFVSDYAVEFIEQNNVFVDKKIYNGWSSGGDLGWRWYGKRKIFIDGRYIFLDILEEHLNAMTSKQRWKDFYKKYDFDYAIYSIYGNKKTEVIRVRDNSKIYLIERPFYLESIDFENWAVVFFDSVNMILVRRDRFPKDFIKKYEYRCILPYDFDRINLDIHYLSKNIKCYRKEMTDYIKRNIKNPDAFTYFFTDKLYYLNSRRVK